MIGTTPLVEGVAWLLVDRGAPVDASASTAHPIAPSFTFNLPICGTALFGTIVPARRTKGRLL